MAACVGGVKEYEMMLEENIHNLFVNFIENSKSSQEISTFNSFTASLEIFPRRIIYICTIDHRFKENFSGGKLLQQGF